MVDGVAGWITAVVLTGERATPKQSRLIYYLERVLVLKKTGFPISAPFLEAPFPPVYCLNSLSFSVEYKLSGAQSHNTGLARGRRPAGNVMATPLL